MGYDALARMRVRDSSTYAEAVKFAADHPDATQAEIEEKLARGEQ